MHGFFPRSTWFFTMQQVQEMAPYGIIIGFSFYALTIVAVVVPVQQHGTQRSHQAVSNIACTGVIVIIFFWQYTTQRRYTSTHDIHRMGRCWQAFQRSLDIGWQATQGLQLSLVALQLCNGRQFAMHQQMGNFFKLAGICHVQNIVATVMQVITGFAYSTQGSIASSDARQGDGFLGFERNCFSHDYFSIDTLEVLFPPADLMQHKAGNVYLVLFGFLLCKQGIQLLFEIVVIDAFIQFHTGLHGIYDILLRTIAAYRAIDVFCSLVHGTES